MEYWTAGHARMFVVALFPVYAFWMVAKYAEIRTNHQSFQLVWTGCTVVFLLWLASVASGYLGMSGAIVALLGGIIGLQMANMPAFEQAKEIDKKPPEAEKAAESGEGE